MALNNQRIEHWGHTAAKTKIKAFVASYETFTSVKQFFQVNHPDDEKVILTYYIEQFYESLPENIERYAYNLFENQEQKLIAQWIEFVYGVRLNSDFEYLLQNEDFYKCLFDLKQYKEDLSYDWIVKTIKKCFGGIFLEMDNLNGIIAIYQCLLRCERRAHHSAVFCDAVKVLWEKCEFENSILHLEPNENSEIDVEHQRLAMLVNNFTGTDLDNVKNLLKDLFKPTDITFSVLSHGIKQSILIEGHRIIFSSIHNEIIHRMKNNSKITSIIIRAKNVLILNQDFTLPGITISCQAAEVIIPNSVTVDLSGRDAIVDQKNLKPAKNGIKKGEKGEDGKDGTAGHPSGNFALFTKSIQGEENLNFILNGGNGTNGQDGGKGADGEDGIGGNFENLDKFTHELEKACKRFGRIVLGGVGSNIFKKKVEKRKEDGSTKLINESPYYLSLHTVEFIKGSDGKTGGKGGKNGLSGEGGKKGKCVVKINDIERHNIKVKSQDGTPGMNGLPGINGGYGMEGWDIAKATKTFAKPKKYGTSLNQKLTLKYTNNSTDKTFRIAADDKEAMDEKRATEEEEKSERKRYAYIESRVRVKKDLKEHELRTEFKDESERSGEAIAKEADAIETESLTDDYEHTSAEKTIEKIEQEGEINVNEDINTNRIIEFVADLVEEAYIPKERPSEFLFPSEKEVEGLNLLDDSSQLFWNSTTKFSIEILFERYRNTWILNKVKKKQLLYKLRSEKNSKLEVSGKWQNTFSHAEVASLRENLQQYYTTFCVLRNIKVNGKCVDFYLPNIENAFKKKKNFQILAEYIVSSNDPMLKEKISNLSFNDIKKAYELLSDDIKQHDPILLFYYLKISENLALYNIFSETALSEIDENVFQGIKKFLMLQKKRSKQGKNVVKLLEKYTKKYACEYDITCDSQVLQSKINKLFTYILPETSSISTYISKEIEIISTTLPAVVTAFLNSLLLVFEVEGCHIDVITLKYLIDTVFDACKMYGTISCYVFPSMLLTYTQEKWLDQFIFFNLESSFNCELKRKTFMKILKNFKDENLKILCANKVNKLSLNETMTEEKLLELFKAVQSKTSLYPQLKDLSLNEWITNMEKINFEQNFKSAQWDALGENKKQNVSFWFSKISERFGIDNAKVIFKDLIEFSHKNAHAVGRFVHRLCSDEYVIDISTTPLKDIFNAALNCLTQETFLINDEECSKIAKELIGAHSVIDLPIPRRLNDIRMLFKNLNPKHCGEDIFQDVLAMVSTIMGDQNVSLIESCASINPIDDQYISLYDRYKEEFRNSIVPENLLLLEIFDNILYKTCGCNLRYTQKIAILSALQHYDPNAKRSGILQEVATGEGKTYIIAAVSIISALKGQTVNIITSSPVLAKRDALLMKPLYDAFGLKVDHIYHTCSQRRKTVYSTCHIVYGDLTTYQRDFLMDKFHGTQIATNRALEIVIVDEVDSLLLDNGLNTLYLSHNIADFELLHSVIIQIWNLVNLQAKESGKCKENESFYQKVSATLFPAISWKDFSKILEISQDEANNLKDIMIENGIATDRGELIVLSNDILEQTLEKLRENFENIKADFYRIFHAFCVQKNDAPESRVNILLDRTDILTSELNYFVSMLKQNGAVDDSNKTLINEKENLENIINVIEKQYFDSILRFHIKYNEIMGSMVVDIPEHLKSYVKMHLKEFIANAELALQMEADVEYQVTIPTQTTISDKAEPQIVIVDRDTGVHQPKAQWHKGLHQFLQLKHGLRLTPLSIKAVFISNISYFRKFPCIFGFSGTLGSEFEKQQLNKFYGLKSVVIPSSNVNQFYEERTIITSTKGNHYKEIFKTIQDKLLEGRSILIIADSIKQVTQISHKIKEISEQLPDNQRKPFDSMILYKYDYENYLDKIDELDGKRIIIATNLAGRGIDIKLTKELKAKGGLHVIIAFHPRNIRIEEQAFGRAARCGEYGTAQLIICDRSFIDDENASIMELKLKRNMNEKQRMQKIGEHYENSIKVQKKCFSLFSKKFDYFKFELQKVNDNIKNNAIKEESVTKSLPVNADTNNSSQQLSSSIVNSVTEASNQNITASVVSDSDDESALQKQTIVNNNEAIDEVIKECDEYSKILINDILDKWALFLDGCEYEWTTADSRIQATENFCNGIKINQAPTQPLNILRYAIVKINKNRYDEAKKYLENLANKFPAYAPEAQYYLVYITAKEKEGKKQFKEIEKELCEIRNAFSKRLYIYIKNSNIVEQHIVEEENRIFKCDTFMQQQKESMLFIKQIIASLDGFFGQIIRSNAFTTDRICEEASMFLFKYFSDTKIYGKYVPITGLQIKKTIDEKKLETYCKRNGISLSCITERLKVLKEKEHISAQCLQKEFGIPKWEDFWSELDQQTLLQDLKEHMFINKLRMPKLSASVTDPFKQEKLDKAPGNRLYQHLFVTNSEWEEVDKEKMRNNVESELLQLLLQNGIICETKSAILSEEISTKMRVKFQQFFTITKNDLMHYGIAEDEADVIIKKLVNDQVLAELENSNYRLSTPIMNDNPEWYSYIVIKLIKQKLAFGLAYLTIKSDVTVNKETLLTLSLIFNDDEETFTSDLIDAGILENTNVNLTNLNKVRIDENIIRKRWEGFFETEASFNILKALEAAEEFIEKIFGEENVTFSIKRAKWYKGMLPNPDILKINQIFDESATVNQKWKTFDIKLVPIKEIMQNETENSHLMITHGLTHLINFHEKRWSKKALKKATGITVLGLIEFAGGCATFLPGVTLSVTGIGAVAAAAVIKPLIFEGLNDMLFGLKSFYTGYSDGWLKYKMINMALNLTFIGGTQILKFMKFAEFSLLKAIFSKTDAAITGTINAGKHAISSIKSSLLKVREKEDKYLYVQNGTTFAVAEIFKQIQIHINNIFESLEHTNKLQEIVKEYLQMFGVNSNCIVDNDNFDIFVKPAIYEICHTIVAELRRSILEDKEITKENSFEVRIKNIINSADFKRLLTRFERKLLSKKPNQITEEEEDVLKTKSIQLIDKWKLDIQEKCNTLLKEKVEIPLNYENEAEYQKQMNAIVTKAYSELKNHGNVAAAPVDDFRYKSINLSKQLAEEFKNDFFIKLEQIQRTSQDPELYAAALLNGSSVDAFGADILSTITSRILSMQIVIRNADMKETENISATEVVICQDNDLAEIENSVYDQIIHQLSDLTNHFGNIVAFQKALANELAASSSFFIRINEMAVSDFNQDFEIVF